MPLINPTKQDKRRFIKLQEEGLLPIQALKQIETEKRLGLTPRPGILDIDVTKKIKDNWQLVGGFTAITIAIIYVYITARARARAPASINPRAQIRQQTQSQIQPHIQMQIQSMTIYDIEGVDFEALNIVRNKGLL